MLPGSARAQTMRPKRFVAFYVPCGIRMNRWTPAATGANYALSPTLQPLGAYNGAASIKDMGRTIAVLKERYAGQMDFAKASGIVKAALG